MNTRSLIFFVLYLLVLSESASHAQVPSLINYQGRLADANGAPVTGSKNFVIRLYDAQTGGTLLYAEDLGSVSLGTNGIYSFQFGSAGSSNTLTSETVATTNGTSTTFQKVLSSSPVVAGSVSVSDGTYTWSEASGSSDEENFGVSYSSSLRRVTVTYYSGPPASGRYITATYRAVTTGISGALAGVGEHWMELSVDGTAQTPRTRLLAVPFAIKSNSSDTATALKIDTFRDLPFNFFTSIEGYYQLTGQSIFLPRGIVGRGYGEAWTAVQPVPTGAKTIRKVTVDVEANNTSNSFGKGGGYGGVRLVRVSLEGIKTTVQESFVELMNGIATIEPNHEMDHERFQYFIEIFVGDVSNGGVRPGQAVIKKCKISFDGYRVYQ